MKHVAVSGVLLLFLCGTRVEAQGVASSFDQLGVLVKPGDKITVVDTAGTEAEGRVGKLSRDTLTLITPSGLRALGEADVAQIRQRRGDSLRNGAIIGAAAGAAYYTTMVAIFWNSDGGDVFVPSVIVGGAIFAGMGAAAGVGIDALIAGRQVIYRNPSSGTRLTVSPLFGRGRRGAAVTLRF